MGEFDKILKEVIWTGISLYVISMFVEFFDYKIGIFLRKVSYLFALSVLLIIGSSLYTTFSELVDVLGKISEFKIFNLLGGN